MAAFFDVRADEYERHMFATIENVDTFYASLADALPRKPSSPEILDLGIGTGLELDAVFERFPRASVTGIDVSAGMMNRLARKHRPWFARVRTIHGSFFTRDLGTCAYDAVVSSMALHHWIPSIKLDLYRRVRTALRPAGTFINADYTVTATEAAHRLQAFAHAATEPDHSCHIDLPLTEDREVELLQQAGFGSVTVTFRCSNACTFRAIAPPRPREARD
jgi:SAM-dependent methyltransferase